MTATAALGTALVALAGLLALLALVVTAARAVRLSRDRRLQRRAAPYRALLLELAAGDPAETEGALRTLSGLDRTRWAAVEPSVGRILHKVRGETHRAVVELLERRGTLDAARRRTRSRSLVRRAKAAELLGAAGRGQATRHLVPLLDDPEHEVRQAAARALARSGDGAVTTALLEHLTGPHAVPQRVIASAVVRLGGAAHPELVRALGSSDADRRAAVAEIAGLSGAITCAPALVGTLRDDDDPEVRIRSARALGRLGAPVAGPALVEATHPANPPALRAVAARALGDLGDVAAVPALEGLLASDHHHVASNAARALAELGPAGRSVLARAADEDGDVAEDAVRARAHARDALATVAVRERAGAA